MKYFPGYTFLVMFFLIAVIAAAGCTGIRSPARCDHHEDGNNGHAWRIDHAVVVVDNLSASMERFHEAGFNVVPGGEHADNLTGNALIPFRDGSYLELFAPTDPALAVKMQNLVSSGTFDTVMAGSDAMQRRFMLHLAEGTGLRDFAVSAPGLNISEEQVHAGRGGFVLEGPIPMSRIRPDGVIVRWRVAVPVFRYATCVPFLIVDDSPRTLRVPDGNLTSHPNGVTGIRGIEIATSDPVAVACWYDTVLSTSPTDEVDTRVTYMLNGSGIIIRGIAGNEREGLVNITLATDSGGVFSFGNFTAG